MNNLPDDNGAIPMSDRASQVSSRPDGGWSYEATVTEIESIITRIELGELELSAVFDQFAIAVDYLHHCEAFLNQQKQRMDLLIETLEDDPDDF